MKKKKHIKKLKNSKVSNHRYIIGVLFSFIVLVLPLITRLKISSLSGEALSYFPTNNGYVVDLALYYKNISFIIITVLLLLFFIGERIYPEKKIAIGLFEYKDNRKYIMLSIIFIILILLSYIFSVNKEISLIGAPNSYEGTLTWIGYILLFLMAINYFEDSFYLKFIAKPVLILLIFFSIFGVVEFFYKSPLEIPFIQYLILPKEQWGQIGKLKLTSYFGQISLTLFNPNYVGQFLMLILPLSFIYGISERQSLLRKFLYIILSGLLILLLFLSGSTAAVYAFIIGCLIQCLLCEKNIVAKRIVLSFLVLLIVSITTYVFQNVLLLDVLLGDQQRDNFKLSDKHYYVNEIRIQSDGIYFDGNGSHLLISYDEQSKNYVFFNGNENIPFLQKNKKYVLEDEIYQYIKLSDYTTYFSVDLGYKEPVCFTIIDEKYYAIGPNGSLIEEINDQSGYRFEKYYKFATGRGYIWNKSIPLLKETLVIGYGNDSSAFHIPQNDFAGKLNYHGSANMVIDKPHNMFLQMSLNTGVLSLLVFSLMIFFYYLSCFKIFVNNTYVKTNATYNYCIAIFTGITSYLICGAFYDSSVTVAPLFWLLLGAGICINNKIKSKINMS